MFATFIAILSACALLLMWKINRDEVKAFNELSDSHNSLRQDLEEAEELNEQLAQENCVLRDKLKETEEDGAKLRGDLAQIRSKLLDMVGCGEGY